jgi:hypothetical protein
MPFIWKVPSLPEWSLVARQVCHYALVHFDHPNYATAPIRARISYQSSRCAEWHMSDLPSVISQEADVSTQNLAEENAASESRMLRFSHEPAVRSEANSSIRIGIRCGRTTARLQVHAGRWIASVRPRVGDHAGNRNADGESWITNGRLDARRSRHKTLNMKQR